MNKTPVVMNSLLTQQGKNTYIYMYIYIYSLANGGISYAPAGHDMWLRGDDQILLHWMLEKGGPNPEHDGLQANIKLTGSRPRD